MIRLSSLILGIVIGGVLVFGAQHYHLLKTNEGMYLVPKTKTTFTDAYVDIRQFTIADWTRHTDLAAAIVKARKEHLLGRSAGEIFQESLNGAVQDTLRTAIDGLTSPKK